MLEVIKNEDIIKAILLR